MNFKETSIKLQNQRTIQEENIFVINELIKDFKFRRIINSLKFTYFFYKKRERNTLWQYLIQFLKIFKYLITIKYKHEFTFRLTHKSNSSAKTISYATINTSDALHYKNIESKIIELLEEELSTKNYCIRHFILIHDKNAPSTGLVKQFAFKIHALVVLLSLVVYCLLRGSKDAKDLVLSNLEMLFQQIIKYTAEYYYFLELLKKEPPKFLVTINENWMPQSVIIDCCNKLRIPTIIYPHGILNPLNLPSACDIVLFWTKQMKESFENLTTNQSQNLIIGALEPLVQGIENQMDEPKYDVLIISQLLIANDKENKRYKEIFSVWLSYIKRHNNFSICIKMHPFEGEKELNFLKELFKDVNNRVTIIYDKTISILELIKISKRISTVSSSSIPYGYYYKKPVLLYNPPQLLMQNFPVPQSWIFMDYHELLSKLENEHQLYLEFTNDSCKWVSNDEVKRNFKLLLNKLI